jgi:glycerol-3-phosphate acyltransferase PlsY
MVNYGLTFLLAYLIGAIPFGFMLYWLCRRKDIREVGSGNIGATNVTRSLGLFGGLLILLIDIFKGLAAVYLAMRLLPDVRWAGFAGLAAIMGHMFPVYLGFRGGKGVATWIGSFILLAPTAMLISLIAFLAAVLTTRFISLGSLTAAACLPLILICTGSPVYLWIPAAVAAALIIFRHRDNIKKILTRTENKFGLNQKSRKQEVRR